MSLDDLDDLLSDYCTPKKLAEKIGEATGVEPDLRTIRRWQHEPDGLATMKLAGRTLVNIPSAKKYIERRLRRPNPRRGT